MYVLILARGYPTEKYKMNGIFEFDQAKALAEAGCKVVFAAVDVRSIRRWRKWGIEHRSLEGVEVYAINLPGGRIPKKILEGLKIYGLKTVYQKIVDEQGKPDLMHAHFAGMGYIASKLKETINIPLVITEHLSSMMKPIIDKGLYRKASIAYNRADALITVSPALQEVIKKRFKKEAIYIPNIVDTKLFSYSPNKSDGTFRFISIGGLIYRKRMDLTIEAFARAFEENDKVKLTIIGEGTERTKLENIINKYELNNKVKLLGLQSRQVIADNLKKSDCFVLPSQAETFGVVYIEALASGVPVIATRCGGPEGFINKKNGAFIPVDNMELLVDAMRNMYNKNHIYDREEIAQETKNKFSPDSVAKRLIRLYSDISSNYKY